MGMYDVLKCEVALPDTLAYILPPDVEWQTKSLDCVLDGYIIRADGLYKYVYADEVPLQVEETRKVEDFHGDVDFYSPFRVEDECSVWIECRARFTSGALESITVTQVHEQPLPDTEKIGDVEFETRKGIGGVKVMHLFPEPRVTRR